MKATAASASASVSVSKSEVVLEVLPNDVLLGRGSGPNDHIGNIKFRDLIASRKQEYLSTNNRQAKATIASEIADVILTTMGGRFLKKITPSAAAKIGYEGEEEEEDVEVYQIQDKATVLEKAKQALRQNPHQNKTLQNQNYQHSPPTMVVPVVVASSRSSPTPPIPQSIGSTGAGVGVGVINTT
mmetsp:Transcript_2755/g.3264  ORF Transcript_2755/g.3264 Transcript_2755/m.3264 type:complete len:185 (+) Transcript_2755:1-555(+)